MRAQVHELPAPALPATSPAVIVVSAAELELLVERAVRRAIEGSERPEPMEWLEPEEAAKMLRVNVRTVTRMAQRGDLPSSRIGPKLLRFERRALEAYLRGERR